MVDNQKRRIWQFEATKMKAYDPETGAFYFNYCSDLSSAHQLQLTEITGQHCPSRLPSATIFACQIYGRKGPKRFINLGPTDYIVSSTLASIHSLYYSVYLKMLISKVLIISVSLPVGLCGLLGNKAAHKSVVTRQDATSDSPVDAPFTSCGDLVVTANQGTNIYWMSLCNRNFDIDW